MRALAAASALLLAGCAAPGPAPGPEAAPEVLAWGLADCRAVVAVFPIRAAAIADRVPEGFRLTPPGERNLPPDPRGDAFLGAEMFRCAEATGLDGTLQDVAYGSILTFAEPPDELLEDVDLLALKWETLEPDEARRARLAAVGAPALGGDARWTRFDVAGHAVSFSGLLTLDGVGEVAFDGFAAADGRADFGTLDFTEWTPARDGLVVWRGHVENPVISVGAATLRLPAGSVLRDAAGRDTVDAYAFAFTPTFAPANVTLPQR